MFPKVGLTNREKEVISLICRGFSNQEIAQILCVTSYTVKAHVCSILKKLKVHNRTFAAVKYICLKYGIQDVPEELKNN